MTLLVGLGNPGDKYALTRHNVGFMLLDLFARKNNLQFTNFKKSEALIAKGEGFILAKPQTFMNSSGKAVAGLLSYFKVSPAELYVIHDDLDILLGDFKIQFGRGPKVHGGINSIEDEIKTTEFWRVRIGVDNREPENRVEGEEYVLQKFSADEKTITHEIIAKAALELQTKLTNGH